MLLLNHHVLNGVFTLHSVVPVDGLSLAHYCMTLLEVKSATCIQRCRHSSQAQPHGPRAGVRRSTAGTGTCRIWGP